MNLEIRYAKPSESKLILEFIKGIAEYEKLSDQVTTTEEELYNSIFVEKSAKVIIAFLDDIPVGFALFFYNFSTFKGRKGLYLEDLFVYKQYRGKGIGNALFNYLLSEAKKNNCGRMEWVCLNWNQPAIDFYLSKKAIPMDEWTTFRIDELDF
ncbi:MAG: GNAT family N-acetyltransferase [Candidatus Izemoplasmatales bacterium]|jgi:GNAT superfamily N-acetyltransferase|nr:GNAT family N-acetyltransferase [Candidatus Izemoplasmatales bacterium]